MFSLFLYGRTCVSRISTFNPTTHNYDLKVSNLVRSIELVPTATPAKTQIFVFDGGNTVAVPSTRPHTSPLKDGLNIRKVGFQCGVHPDEEYEIRIVRGDV